MAAVAGGGGSDGMLLLRPRPRRQRLPLADLTNLSSATSVITRLKPKPRPRPRTSPASSIGSSTVPRIPSPPPPAALSASVSVTATKGKDKVTRELQSSTTHLNKIQKISKPKVKTGGVLPGLSSPPSKKTRKITRKEQPHTEPLISPLHASTKRRVKTGGNMLPATSTPPSKKTRKVTSSREEQPRTEPLVSFATSVVTRLKPLRTSPASSTSSIGSSTVPRIPTPPSPAALSVAATKGKHKVTRELQSSSTHLNKIQKISKPKVKTRGVLPGPSSPPSKNTRKVTSSREELPRTEPLVSPLYASSKTRVKTLPGASSSPCSKKTRKVRSSSREEQLQMEEMSCDESLVPSEDFIEERRAYFAFELVEEFVLSGSDAE